MDANRLMILKFYDLIFGIVMIIVSLIISYIIASFVPIEAGESVVLLAEMLSARD